jgi:hypothetical protein
MARHEFARRKGHNIHDVVTLTASYTPVAMGLNKLQLCYVNVDYKPSTQYQLHIFTVAAAVAWIL